MHPEHVCDKLGDAQHVGLTVARTGHGNMHLGIAYQWRGGHYLYHQAFHVDTRLEPFDAGVASLGGASLVVALPFRPARMKAVAGFLNHLGDVDPQYPYSLKYDPRATIDPVLGKLVTSDGKGLSCVTFVLAVFQSFQIRLIDAATWPVNRPDDLAAQQWLINVLESRPDGVSAEHLAAVKAEKGCTRVRPEEAGGSGLYTIVPIKFEQAEPAGLHLVERIRDKLKPA